MPFFIKKRRCEKNATEANYRVYRTVKSAIDYRRVDYAITHPRLKYNDAYSACDKSAFAFTKFDAKIENVAGHSCILSRLTSIYIFLASICISEHAMRPDRPFYVLLLAVVYIYRGCLSKLPHRPPREF